MRLHYSFSRTAFKIFKDYITKNKASINWGEATNGCESTILSIQSMLLYCSNHYDTKVTKLYTYKFPVTKVLLL